MRTRKIWRQRGRTAKAMVLLCLARLLVSLAPLRRWRSSLGYGDGSDVGRHDDAALVCAGRLARHVERAAWRLPFEAKCLPQAMALSWLLRAQGIGHHVVIAVKPAAVRHEEHGLHAWVEMRDIKLIGDLPGPWHVLFRSPP
ncbi:MAG: lasso peptide biosynthesis B2 protein [Sphingomonadaceae bacterium]|nr:lasso peptide biosynthesis B2 protein [Sphingomonadaceae bacterium]